MQAATAAPTGMLNTIAMVALTGLVLAAGMLMGDRLTALGNWSYLAVALAEFMDAATPFVPTPAHAYTYSVAASWNPLLVAVLASVSSTLGETVGYVAGCNGQRALQGSGFLRRCASLFGRWEGKVVVALAAIPFPVYLAGVWAGTFGISYRRFFLFACAGKMVLFSTIGVLGYLRG